jgi:hypothetical protein
MEAGKWLNRANSLSDWGLGSAPMILTVTRLDSDGRYKTLITRDDGVIFSLRGVGHNFAIPHDVAHFVIEKALGLHAGFWGSIADGAVFPTMNYESGRRKPKAAERSKAVMKANARKLVEAEVLVRVFNDTIEQGHRETSSVLVSRLRERCCQGQEPSLATQAKIPKVYLAYHDVQSNWNDTPVGGMLSLNWESNRMPRAVPR